MIPVYGALAVTATVLLVVAMVLAFAAGEAWDREAERRFATFGWSAFAMSALLFIAATWTAVIS